jgi:mannose-6-phosphate isomerase-like protein (cupin superfamily)
MMTVVRFAEKPEASWRPGKFGRLHAAAAVGPTARLCINESWNDKGIGAPTHHHPDGLEEVIMVLEGRARFWIDDETFDLEAGDLIIIPAFAKHGFTNPDEEKLHVLAVFSAPAPETIYESEPDKVVRIGGVAGDQVDSTRVSSARQI